MNKKIIIAKSYNDYERALQFFSLKRQETIFPSELNKLVGWDFFEDDVFWFGDWYNRTDSSELLKLVQSIIRTSRSNRMKKVLGLEAING